MLIISFLLEQRLVLDPQVVVLGFAYELRALSSITIEATATAASVALCVESVPIWLLLGANRLLAGVDTIQIGLLGQIRGRS